MTVSIQAWRNDEDYAQLPAEDHDLTTLPMPLEFVEIPPGSYLGEDDIVRFDDVYGRA